MRIKHLLPILTMMAIVSCQKSEIAPERLDKNASARIEATTTTDECDVVTFDEFTGGGGYVITAVTSEDGIGIGIASRLNQTTRGPAANIFNTAAPHPADLDLGSTNQAFGGPGVGAGGASGPFANDVALGNIIIIQNPSYQFSTPITANEVNSQIDFAFPEAVIATSIQVIDVDEGERGIVSLFTPFVNGSKSHIKNIPIPATGANGVATIDLGNTPNVGSISIFFSGSMGFDNLRFCDPTPPVPPIPTEGGCTRGQGYYKNNPNAWAVGQLTIGGTVYSKATLISDVFKSKAEGNGVIILARQLIAAKLNMASGAGVPVEIQDAIKQADAMLTGINLSTGTLPSSQVSALATLLDQYNKGNKGIVKCV